MIVFDVETSGLDEKTNGILGLGAITLPGGDTFYHEPRLIDELEAHPKALEVNGFTEEEIRSKDRTEMPKTLKAFANWATGADDMILGGWNGTFDYRFLAAEFTRHDIRWPFKYRVVDIQTIAYTVMRIRDNWTPMHDGVSTVGLNYTLKWLGMEPEAEPHNALTGAQANVDVLMALTKMIQIVPLIKPGEPDGIEVPQQLDLLGGGGEVPVDAHAGHHEAQYTAPDRSDPDYAKWLSSQE